MLARIADIAEADYHADQIGEDRPSLSSSVAHTLLAKSPLHAWAQHPKLGCLPRKPTAEMDMGTLVHGLLLGSGPPVVCIEADSFRTKAAQTARDDAREAGAVPVLAAEYEQLSVITAALRVQIASQGVSLDKGQPEATLIWEDDDVLCRRRVDLLDLEAGIVTELKTITSADAGTCSRHAYQFSWDISAAATLSALNQIDPGLAGRVIYRHVIIEKEARAKPPFAEPYVAVVREHDGAFEELGMRRWERAVRLWKRCLQADSWPGYEATPLTAPLWAIQQEEMEE